MNRIRKLNCIVLSVVILIASVFVSGTTLNAFAATKGYVDATNVHIRAEASTKSSSLGKVSNVYVQLIGSPVKGEKVGSTDIWYKVTYEKVTGYIFGEFITEIKDYVTDKTFEEQIAAFPESYRPALRELHAQYPNWRFYPDNLDLTFDQAVALEITRKLVHNSSDKAWLSMGEGAYNWTKEEWVPHDTNWYVASRELIQYYMDPRNFLDPTYVFSYVSLDYDKTTQTKQVLEKILAGTFLANNYKDDNDKAYGGSYAEVIMAAAEKSNVSPYFLASKIIQEQGTAGTSDLISGKYGAYNFFNVQATGSSQQQKIDNGIAYAKKAGWYTRSASIIGGAEFCATNYVAVGQNTHFYMNFNIKNPDKIWHEYALAVHDAANSAQKAATAYTAVKTDTLNFLIPVYKNMPSSAVQKPAKSGKLNNYYFNSISIPGLTPTFSRFTYKYDLRLSGNATIGISVPEKAAYKGPASFNLKKGNNTVVLTVMAESGYTTDYTISVAADNDCVLTVNYGDGSAPSTPTDPTPPPPTILKGDTSGDGIINGRDAANIQMHILDIKKLSGDAFKGGDTNGDGVINGRDAANVQMHILDIKKLN